VQPGGNFGLVLNPDELIHRLPIFKKQQGREGPDPVTRRRLGLSLHVEGRERYPVLKRLCQRRDLQCEQEGPHPSAVNATTTGCGLSSTVV
jgi:hypothetical protein